MTIVPYQQKEKPTVRQSLAPEILQAGRDAARLEYRRKTPLRVLGASDIQLIASAAFLAAFGWVALIYVPFFSSFDVVGFMVNAPGIDLRSIVKPMILHGLVVYLAIFAAGVYYFQRFFIEHEEAIIIRTEQFAADGAKPGRVKGQKVIRLDLQVANNHIQHKYLPTWFGDEDLENLVEHVKDGGNISRADLEKEGICKQAQYPELMQALLAAGLVMQKGKGFEITKQFGQLYEVE
jgi:hypothetical protein